VFGFLGQAGASMIFRPGRGQSHPILPFPVRNSSRGGFGGQL
jgi:hypothetical protein